MKLVPAVLAAFLISLSASPAAVLVSGFSTNGALLGQTNPGTAGGTWAQVGGTVTNPLTVTSGTLGIKPTGQALAIPVLPSGVDNGTFYYGLTLNLSAAQSGNMFLSFSANNTLAPGGGARLSAAASGGGFVLGGSVGTTNVNGGGVLNFNTDYRIVFRYNLVTGSGNDSVSIYVNPVSTSNEGANTPYLTIGPATGLTSLQYFQITQTSSSNGPTGGISNFAVTTTFSEAAIPEPTTAACLLGGLSVLFLSRRVRRSPGLLPA